jgi:hypothetical protein
MILTIYKIRLLQLFRLLTLRVLIGIIIVLIFFLYAELMVGSIVHTFLAQSQNTFTSLIFMGLLILSAHVSRTDKHFLEKIFKNPYSIYLSEYLLLSLPFFIIWLINYNLIGLGGLILITFVIPLIRLKLNIRNIGSISMLLLNPFSTNLNSKLKVSLPFISPISFEWISGIRRNLLILTPTYLFLLAFSFKPYVAVLGLIFLSILISGFYFYGESREFVESFANSPKEFILKKILINFRQLLIVFTPILLISLIFQPSTWYYLIGALIVSSLIQVYAVLYKYGLFEENTNLNRNKIIYLLFALSIVIPGFIFIPIIIGIRSYKKALKNLNQYFYD